MAIRSDKVEQTYIGNGLWTVEAWDCIGRRIGSLRIKYEAAADSLARIFARSLDGFCDRDDLSQYINKIR
jgi:hypothetical protein